MSMSCHNKAAKDHEAAAQAHHAAADLHGKGDHSAALEKSTEAHSCCCSAQKSTEDAHKMSAQSAQK